GGAAHRPYGGAGVGGGDPGRSAVGLAEDGDPAGAVADEGARQGGEVLGEPSGGAQADPVVQRGSAVPQAGPGEQGERPERAGGGELEGDPAAERVAGHVGCRYALVVEEGGHGGGDGVRRWFDVRGQRRGFAVPGQVDGDDVESVGEPVEDGVP